MSRRKILLKCIVIGDAFIGKTSIINYFLNNRKANRVYKITVGDTLFGKELMIDNTLVTLQVWDTCGQERFQSLGPAFYRGSDLVVLTFDVSSVISMRNVWSWQQEAYEQGVHITTTMVLVGNKIDLPPDPQIKEEVAKFKQRFPWIPYYETSARNGTGVSEMFQQACKAVIRSPLVEIDVPIFPNLENNTPPVRWCNT